jgi:hypothetical protein
VNVTVVSLILMDCFPICCCCSLLKCRLLFVVVVVVVINSICIRFLVVVVVVVDSVSFVLTVLFLRSLLKCRLLFVVVVVINSICIRFLVVVVVDSVSFVLTVLFLHAQWEGRVLRLIAPVEKCGSMAPITCGRATDARCISTSGFALPSNLREGFCADGNQNGREVRKRRKQKQIGGAINSSHQNQPSGVSRARTRRTCALNEW